MVRRDKVYIRMPAMGVDSLEHKEVAFSSVMLNLVKSGLLFCKVLWGRLTWLQSFFYENALAIFLYRCGIAARLEQEFQAMPALIQ